MVLEAAALREKFCSYFLTNSGELVLSLQSLPYRVSSSINASFSRANNCKRLIVETEKDKQQFMTGCDGLSRCNVSKRKFSFALEVDFVKSQFYLK